MSLIALTSTAKSAGSCPSDLGDVQLIYHISQLLARIMGSDSPTRLSPFVTASGLVNTEAALEAALSIDCLYGIVSEF